MTTFIRNLSDLHLIKAALRAAEEAGNPDAHATISSTVENLESQFAPCSATTDADLNDQVELDRLLAQHDFWLGFSPIKGWALLDRKHPEYSAWNRPFLLLGNENVDRLSSVEFRLEPNGPWRLDYWKHVAEKTRQEAATLVPNILRYIQKAEQAAQRKAGLAADQNEDIVTQIGEPPFNEALYSNSRLEFREKWDAARREYYANALPVRAEWLRRWAKKMIDGAIGLEPAWSRGTAAAQHLSNSGISHLWHFTDIRNLATIRRVGGLYSWEGLDALGIEDVSMMADNVSRSCDARLGRGQYVRLSFIPNSWFFQRTRGSRRAVWLRFSVKALTLGEVAYSLGNAASGFVRIQSDLQLTEIDWNMVTPFSGQCSNEIGPTQYPKLYPEQVANPELFRQIKDAWNSEILIKHFLPIEFCNGAFDSRNGKPVLL